MKDAEDGAVRQEEKWKAKEEVGMTVGKCWGQEDMKTDDSSSQTKKFQVSSLQPITHREANTNWETPLSSVFNFQEVRDQP